MRSFLYPDCFTPSVILVSFFKARLLLRFLTTVYTSFILNPGFSLGAPGDETPLSEQPPIESAFFLQCSGDPTSPVPSQMDVIPDPLVFPPSVMVYPTTPFDPRF